MNSQLVIVKGFTNRPMVKKSCYSVAGVVFVTSESAFKAIESGDSGLFPIGFRIENVFIYEGQKLDDNLNWKTLKPFPISN